MALEEYKRKRDFAKTPEPAPVKPAARKGFSYLIQKHDATRLHYDFRLELDGVLLSWAVTKGPSLNPADKRLAVHVEDHPLSYGTFEGIIPKGQYGGGTVMLWDRGSWEPEFDPDFGMKKGHLAFTLHGERLKGAWDLVRMHGGKFGSDGKRDNWLLIKKKDAYAEDEQGAVKFLEDENTSVSTGRTMDEIAVDAPAAVRASAAKAKSARASSTARHRALKKNGASAPDADMATTSKSKNFGRGLADLVRRYPHVELATLVSAPPEGGAWLHEIKFDGYRLLAFLAEGDVRLRTRNGNDWTLKFPSIYASVSKLKTKNAVLDMEAVVLDGAGKSSFQALQRALGEEGDAQSIQAYVFDLLHLDGASLTGKPLTERKAALQSLLKKSKLGVRSAGSTWNSRKDVARDKPGEDEYLHYSDHVAGNGAEVFAKACTMELEGIVSKLARSAYQPGRQKSWLKAKCALRQEFVIIGFTAARRGARAIGALHLGYYKEGVVRQHGREKDLTYAGKVGTGFSMRDAQALYDRLLKMEVDAPPADGVPRSMMKAARWVQPSLVCEVSFTEWTSDGHIRHPSYHGLREDKPAQQVRMEKPPPASHSGGRSFSADNEPGTSSGASAREETPRRSRSSVRVHSERARPLSRHKRGAKPASERATARRARPHVAQRAASAGSAHDGREAFSPAASRRPPSAGRAEHVTRRGHGVADPPPAAASAKAERLELLGIAITHPGRVIFADNGLTKGQLAEYYAAAAHAMLKDIAGHPLSVIRCPDGISGQCFFQRSPNTGLGKDIKPWKWRHKGKTYEYFYIDDEKGLMELVQMGSVEIHPWGARAAKIDYPDRLIFDLDPHESVPFEAVKLAAEDLRRRLAEKGLESFLKVTGGKGVHITAPLGEKDDWPAVKAFCAAVADEMVESVPSAYIATMTKAKRTGKIFVDYFRNDYTATAIADWGVRARPGAPVAVPLEWSELKKLRAPNQFTIADALARLKRSRSASAADRYTLRQRLPR